jgi:hypothetical protein
MKARLWANFTDDHAYDPDCEDADNDEPVEWTLCLNEVDNKDTEDGDSGQDINSSSISNPPSLSHRSDSGGPDEDDGDGNSTSCVPEDPEAIGAERGNSDRPAFGK